MPRKKGDKDKKQRKSAILRGLGYTAIGGGPLAGAYLTYRDLKSTGKERKANKFAETGAVRGMLGGVTNSAIGKIAGVNTGGVVGNVVRGGIIGAGTGAGAYYVRRAFAKDRKKFDKGY